MTEINIKLEYPLGSIVYYKTDKDNSPGMIVGVMYCLNGGISYRVSFSGDIHYMYEDELRDHKDFSML